MSLWLLWGDPYHECSCTQNNIDRYLSKISNPLLDRIDIHIEVLPVEYKDLNDDRKLDTSEKIRARVNNARKIQLERYKGKNIYSNSQLGTKDIKKIL